MTRLFVTIALFVVTVALSLDLRTVAQAAQPAPPEPAVCVEWGKAGKWELTKCVDEDGVACISSDSGMLSCKWEY